MNKLITFEGIDGSGKSTQISLLNKWFDEIGVNKINIREPGGSNVSELIRSILLDKRNQINALTETMLFLSARSQLVDEIILPSLAENKFVICDRFIDSTIVYQGYGRGLDINLIHEINALATQNTLPYLTIYIKIDVSLSISRREFGEDDRMESEGRVFLLNVKRGYDKLADLYPERIKVVSGDNDIDTIQEQIRKIIVEKFKGAL